MSVLLTVKQKKPLPGAQTDTPEAEAACVSGQGCETEHAAQRSRWLLGGTAAAVLAALALSSYTPRPPVSIDRPDGITPAIHSQLKTNAAALAKNGLRSGVVRFRDWGAIDGDAAIVNGAFVGPLASGYTGLAVGTGPVIITAKAGAQGCVSVEVADEMGAVYQVCVADGEPIRTFAH